MKPIEPKRLYRSRQDKLIAGVCGGIAEYFAIDPVWVRLVMVLLIFLHGAGIIIYIVAWIIIPKNPSQRDGKQTFAERNLEGAIEKVKKKTEERQAKKSAGSEECCSHSGAVIFGLILIAISAWLLMRKFIPEINTTYIVSGLLVIIGLYLIVRKPK